MMKVRGKIEAIFGQKSHFPILYSVIYLAWTQQLLKVWGIWLFSPCVWKPSEKNKQEGGGLPPPGLRNTINNR